MEVVENKQFKMLPARPGTCAMCATDHPAHHAHNLQSMFYQIRFYLKWKRYPTWADACAHLTELERKAWRQAMREAGAEWTETDEPIREP